MPLISVEGTRPRKLVQAKLRKSLLISAWANHDNHLTYPPRGRPYRQRSHEERRLGADKTRRGPAAGSRWQCRTRHFRI